MFEYAGIFNQPLSTFDTSKVWSMDGMFASAYSFNQNLSSWVVNPNVDSCDSFGKPSFGTWTLPKPSFTLCNPN